MLSARAKPKEGVRIDLYARWRRSGRTFIVSSLLLSSLAIFIHPAFVLGLLAYLLFIAFSARDWVCPRCGLPLGATPAQIGERGPPWRGEPCKQCGLDLRSVDLSEYSDEHH